MPNGKSLGLQGLWARQNKVWPNGPLDASAGLPSQDLARYNESAADAEYVLRVMWLTGVYTVPRLWAEDQQARRAGEAGGLTDITDDALRKWLRGDSAGSEDLRAAARQAAQALVRGRCLPSVARLLTAGPHGDATLAAARGLLPARVLGDLMQPVVVQFVDGVLRVSMPDPAVVQRERTVRARSAPRRAAGLDVRKSTVA